MLKLVYACLAGSAIALTLLVIAAAEQGDPFRGTTNEMMISITSPAVVLAADSFGAVTQTGNGRVAGFAYGGGRRWAQSHARFEEGPDNPFGAGAVDATAACADRCPSALTEFRTVFSAQGGASEQLAEALTELHHDGSALLKTIGADGAFARASQADGVTRLTWLKSAQVTPLSIVDPQVVEVSWDERRAIVGTAESSTGKLTRLQLGGARWRELKPELSILDLKNACISADGDWIGYVARHAERRSFEGDDRLGLDLPIATGTCTVDSQGITLMYTAAGDPKLQAARYDAAGRRTWSRTIGNFKPLSRAGSPYLVAQAADGTLLALDAITGRAVLNGHSDDPPFVGGDGSIVVADRSGKPTWLLRGRKPAR